MPHEPDADPSSAAPWRWPDPWTSMVRAWETGVVQWMAPDQRVALARRRWHALIDHARAQSPFYAGLYARYRLRQTLDPQSLPVVGKSELMADFDRVVTDPRLRGAPLQEFIADPRRAGQPFAGEFAVWTSSGTSGTPGVFVHDARALATYDALQFNRVFGAPLWGLPAPGLGRYAMAAATGGHFSGAAMIERLRSLFPSMRAAWRSFSLMQPLAELVRQLNDFQPDTLATYPSAALSLAQEQQAGRLHIALRHLWTGGECLGSGARAALTAAFGATVREEYGASEFPTIAVGCRCGVLHVNADWVVLEPVDAQHRPVTPGTASHSVLLTNLANYAQPLIRYDLGDTITTLDGVCGCGSTLPAIRVAGRSDDTLSIAGPDGRVVHLLPLVLTTVLEESAASLQFQLAQTGPSAVRLWADGAGTAGPSVALGVLRRYLDAQGLAAVTLEASEVPLWRKDPGSKLRRIRRMAPIQHLPGN